MGIEEVSRTYIPMQIADMGEAWARRRGQVYAFESDGNQLSSVEIREYATPRYSSQGFVHLHMSYLPVRKHSRARRQEASPPALRKDVERRHALAPLALARSPVVAHRYTFTPEHLVSIYF